MNNIDAIYDETYDELFGVDEVDTKISNKFIGKAFVYDEEIFIDTTTGKGYDLVIKKMDKYISWYANKVKLMDFDKNDIKQLIVVMMLDGIKHYNATYGVKLSTFLSVHVKNRMITRIKKDRRQSLNATYNNANYKFICPCGAHFVNNKADGYNMACEVCLRKVDDQWKVYIEHYYSKSLNTMIDNDIVNNNVLIYALLPKSKSVDEIERDLDFVKVFDKNNITYKIASHVYHEGHTISEAAQKFGLSCASASARLKTLKKDKMIQDLLLNNV